jgi:hypothetical protein
MSQLLLANLNNLDPNPTFSLPPHHIILVAARSPNYIYFFFLTVEPHSIVCCEYCLVKFFFLPSYNSLCCIVVTFLFIGFKFIRDVSLLMFRDMLSVSTLVANLSADHNKKDPNFCCQS